MEFEWDPAKDKTNQLKHGVSFSQAQRAFLDPERVIIEDVKHSTKKEKRFFCHGFYNDHILTVRFTYRVGLIRIFGAGFWRQGRIKYEEENNL
jgi:uncharacterized DUF497 family protein